MWLRKCPPVKSIFQISDIKSCYRREVQISNPMIQGIGAQAAEIQTIIAILFTTIIVILSMMLIRSETETRATPRRSEPFAAPTFPRSSPAPADPSGSGGLLFQRLQYLSIFQVCLGSDNRVRGFQSCVWLHSKPPRDAAPHSKMRVWTWRADGLPRWVNSYLGLTLSWLDFLPGNSNVSEEHISYATKYGEPIDCTWIITADPGSQIFIQFAEFELSMPNDCNFNYIQVRPLHPAPDPLSHFPFFQLFDGETDIEGQIITFCGSIAESKTTTTNTLYVRWAYPSQDYYDQIPCPEGFLSKSNVLLFCRYFAEAKGIGSEFAAWFSVLTQQVSLPPIWWSFNTIWVSFELFRRMERMSVKKGFTTVMIHFV